jgi:2-polyprenyl-3-methyl-5-hydroxy-6-metoxy-1,4-benzoquinol methylase
MSTSSLDTVRARFERDAASFDAIYRLERDDLAFAHASDVQDKAILDIGCGSGVYSVDFARRGARRVVGVDFSGNMLELARREAEEHDVTQTCQFIQANFLDLTFPERFDVSIAMGVFDYLAEPVPFLRKMIAATSGRVIASFPGHSPIRKRLRRLRYRVTGKGDVHFYSEADVRRLAADAGLARSSIIPIRSSGTGFVLVGEC